MIAVLKALLASLVVGLAMSAKHYADVAQHEPTED